MKEWIAMIDVTRMVDGETKPIAQAFAVDIPTGYDAAEPVAHVDLQGNLSRVGRVFLFQGKASASVFMVCGRCLRPVPSQFCFDIEEKFCETPDESEWPVAEHAIDLLPAIADNLLPQLPVKTLCAEDCKGLCRICGMDLNESSCGCNTQEVDERLAVLKQWFSDDTTDTDIDTKTI